MSGIHAEQILFTVLCKHSFISQNGPRFHYQINSDSNRTRISIDASSELCIVFHRNLT